MASVQCGLVDEFLDLEYFYLGKICHKCHKQMPPFQCGLSDVFLDRFYGRKIFHKCHKQMVCHWCGYSEASSGVASQSGLSCVKNKQLLSLPEVNHQNILVLLLLVFLLS